jgi:aspartate aminotransferase/aminotransferase
MKISKHVKEIDEALSIYINQVVYDLKRNDREIITLSLGEAFFDLPPLDMKNLDVNKSYHYSDTQGLPILRKQISSFYNKNYKTKIDPDKNLLISAGSKIIIFMCINLFTNPGDEVLIVEPSWLSYKEQIKISNGKIVPIPINEKVTNYKNYISKKTKIIIICNPNHPAGTLYKKSELKNIYKLAKKNNLVILCDEAYSEFTNKNQFYSLGQIDNKLTNSIVINSLSKNFGISGWRIGYVLANQKFTKKLILLNQHLITCAPTILSQYLSENFEKFNYICKKQIEKLLLKRKKITKYLKNKKIKFVSGISTFYIFIKIDKFKGSLFDFAMNLLLKYGISIVPGISYGDSTERYLRLSIGTETLEKIYQSINIIDKLNKENKIDYNYLSKKIKEFGIKKFEGKIESKIF